MASITARYRIVKKSTVGVQKNTPVKEFVPPKLPERPKVTDGPKCYGRTKRGRYIVCRFWIWKRYKGSKWYVIDFDRKGRWENGGVAKGTERTGYETREKAIKIAREYRDTYGAWSRSPF